MLACLAACTVYKYQLKCIKLLIYLSRILFKISVINTKYREFDVSGISPLVAYRISFTLLIIESVYL